MRIWLGLLFIAALSSPALAQETDVERAKKHFEVAELHFGEGEFAQAIEQYRKAHALSEEPLLLFNIGLCHENLGQRAEAIGSYEAYVAADPSGAKAGEAGYRIDKLKKELEAARTGEPAEAKAPPSLTFRLAADRGTFDLSLEAAGGERFDCPKTTFIAPCVLESVPAGPAVLTVRKGGQKARAELVAPAGSATRQIDFTPEDRGYKNVLLYGGIAALVGSAGGFTLAGLSGSDSDAFIPGLLSGVLLGAAGFVGVSLGLVGVGGETVPASVQLR